MRSQRGRETLPFYCHSGLPLSANNFVITGVHCITEVVRILPWSLGQKRAIRCLSVLTPRFSLEATVDSSLSYQDKLKRKPQALPARLNVTVISSSQIFKCWVENTLMHKQTSGFFKGAPYTGNLRKSRHGFLMQEKRNREKRKHE